LAISKAELKILASLKTKKGRVEQQRFLAGGIRVLEEALKFNFLPVKLLYSQSVISERGQKLVNQFKTKGAEIIVISSKELDCVSDTQTTQGIMGVFVTPEANLSKLYKDSYRKLLLCDRINDPGNMGTLVRSAVAFDFNMMLVTNNTVELFNPKVVRSSAGAIFALPAAKVTYSELKEFKNTQNIKVAAAVSQHAGNENHPGISHPLINGERPLILAIGAEAEGLSDEMLSLSDFKISISHHTNVESLNAAVAGSILMYEISEKSKNKGAE
jgi:TrmH family RNA methyltransferase